MLRLLLPLLCLACLADEPRWSLLLERDEEAMGRIEDWIREARSPGTPESRRITLAARIREETAPLEEAYLDFLADHPRHVRARVAYADLLGDLGRDGEILPQLEKAVEIDPSFAPAWNNLGNHHGYQGRAGRAIVCFRKAIALRPREAVYLRNLASITRLHPEESARSHGVPEERILDLALGLYRQALDLDPDSFDLAEDLAQAYYSPSGLVRPEEALAAWKRAEALAPSALEREGVALHLARVFLALGMPKEARRELDLVSLPVYDALRQEIGRDLAPQEPPGDPAPSASPAAD